ncbi:MAG: hypothetical protein ACRDZ3_01230 [Acidimicrobiia bacterium]
MKRVSASLAVVCAVLLMGSASAKVPDTSTESRLRQLGIMRPDGLPGVPGSPAKPEVADLANHADGVEADVVNAVTQAVEEGTPLSDALLAGLPPQVAEILSALPFLPEPAQELLPAPVPTPAEVLPQPEPAPAESSAQPAPAPPPEPKSAPAPAPKLRTAAGDRETVFGGLPTAGHAGTTTGTAIHVDAGSAAPVQLTNIDVAFSGSTFTSSALGNTISNEMARVVSQALGANAGFGRGSGLELGLAQPEGAEAQVILAQRAEAKSPPSTGLIENEIPANLAPAAVASLLRGRAQSRAQAACTTGVDLSYGQGYAADIGLLGAENAQLVQTADDDPARTVNQSTSRTALVPQANPDPNPTGIARFGLMSETRQTLAPVTLLEGTPTEFTIEFLGEWVLRAVADGKGVGEVFYGPGTVSPETPVIRVLDQAGEVMDGLVVTTQQLLGQTGLELVVPGVATIVVGEDPRAIGGDASSAAIESNTYSAGAIDVVRVQLLDGGLADLRIGHMEAAVAVPAGGIQCGIALVKKSSHEVVNPGQDFVWTVTVSNPNDCVLTSVKLVDTISADNGIRWSVVGSEPKANSQANTGLTWNDIGPIQPGGSKDLLINMNVATNSGGGRFLNEALATGVCGPAAGAADAGVGVPLEARVSLNVPRVAVQAEAPLQGELPRTGGMLATLPALALLGLGLVLRRMKARS